MNTDSYNVKSGLLSFILTRRFLEFYSLPELVTRHFLSLVKAYSGPADFLESILPQVY
jgi:hypothetical protein